MSHAESLKNNTYSESDVADGIRFDKPQSQFAPDGMVKPITGTSPIDNVTTQNLNLQNYRMGKFMQAFSNTGFEGLQEVAQPNGSTAWTMDMAIDNQDFNFYLDQSQILKTVSTTPVKNDAEIQAIAKEYNIKPEQTYIIIDGKRYFVRMDVPMHFGTGANNDTWINLGVFVLGDGIMASAIAAVIAGLGFDAFKDALKNLGSALMKTLWAVVKGAMMAVYRFTTQLVLRLLAGDTLAEAAVAARTAAGEAWSSAVEGVTSKTLKYTVVGLIIIVGVMLIIEFVLHESYQNTYFYNLTEYDIELDFPYKDYGDYANLPTKNVEAVVNRIGPGGIDLGTWYNGVAFRFQSNSEFHGLGYTMRFKLKDPKTQAVKKTFSCLFDVPFSGNNSLFASVTEPSSYKSYYSDNSGSQKVTQFSAQDSEQEIIVSYDYLDGKHKDPETGNSLYLYSSLVVIRDNVAPFSQNPSAKLQNSGFLSIASIAAYDFGNSDFTFEAWIKSTDAGTIFGKKSTAGGSSANSGFLVVVEPNGGIKLATDNGFGYSQVVSDAANALDGNWHFVSAVRSGATMSIFIDGKPINTTLSGSLSSPLPVSNDLNLLLGSVQQTQEPHIHFTGAMSEVRVWNKALSQAEINAHMNQPSVGIEAGLVGYWPLRTNGNDLTQHKNNATINGSVTFGDN